MNSFKLNREINHENIVALKEVILEDKSIYMVFEYAEHDFLVRTTYNLHIRSLIDFDSKLSITTHNLCVHPLHTPSSNPLYTNSSTV